MDADYLRRSLGAEPLTVLGLQPGLRRARQEGRCPRPEDLDDASPLRVVAEHVRPADHHRRTARLHELHFKLAQKDWVRSAHGDVSGQVSRAQ